MMIRRIGLILIIVIWTEKPWLLAQLIIFLSVINLGFLVGHKPYKDALTNKIEILNETTVYISALLHIQFLEESDQAEAILRFKSASGWFLIFKVCINLIIQIAIVAF